MPDGVDAAVEAVQLPALHTGVDRVSRQPARAQLRTGDDPALGLRDPTNPPIRFIPRIRGGFFRESRINPPCAAVVVRRGGLFRSMRVHRPD